MFHLNGYGLPNDNGIMDLETAQLVKNKTMSHNSQKQTLKKNNFSTDERR
jgi:hypothetical protein